jgi:hypothetical protein
VSAELAGNNIAAHLLDADDCWKDVCDLRSYEMSGTIATCEMGFARAGLCEHIFVETQRPDVGHRMRIAAIKLVVDVFRTQNSPETRRHYQADLGVAAMHRVSFYTQNAFPIEQLSGVFTAELGVPGFAAVEVSPMFLRIEKRVRDLISKVRIR